MKLPEGGLGRLEEAMGIARLGRRAHGSYGQGRGCSGSRDGRFWRIVTVLSRCSGGGGRGGDWRLGGRGSGSSVAFSTVAPEARRETPVLGGHGDRASYRELTEQATLGKTPRLWEHRQGHNPNVMVW